MERHQLLLLAAKLDVESIDLLLLGHLLLVLFLLFILFYSFYCPSHFFFFPLLFLSFLVCV